MVFHRCAETDLPPHTWQFIFLWTESLYEHSSFCVCVCVCSYVFAGVQNDKYHYDGFWFTQVVSGEINLAAKQRWRVRSENVHMQCKKMSSQ